MATSNGPWVNGGRIEWYYNVNTPAVGATSTTYSVTAYFRTEWNQQYINSGSKSWSGQWGSGSGHQAYALGNQGRLTLVQTSGLSVSVQSSARDVTFTATANHFFGTTSHTLTVSIPAYRPIAASTPTNLRVVRSGRSSNLSWSRGGSTTSVNIDRRVNGGGWSRLASPGGNITSYTDSSIVPGNKYDYRVRGVHEAGVSGWSNTASLTWTLSAPYSLSVSRSGGTASLSWSRAEVVDSHRVERRVNGGAWVQVASPTNNNTSYTDSTILPGNKYDYRVRDLIHGLFSPYSSIVSLTWTQSSPYGLTLERTGGTVVLSWNRSAPVDGFRVEERVNGGTWVQIGAQADTATTYTTYGLVGGNKYDYRVRDVTKGVPSNYSNVASVSLVPGAPSSATVSRASDAQHTITLAGGSPRTSLVIHRQVNDGAWVSLATPAGNLSSWTDTSTVMNRKYRYRVAVVSPGGQSVWVYTPVFFTAPIGSSGLSATRVGDDIRVAISSMPSYATHFDVQDDGVGVATSVPRSSFPWVHTSPSVAVPHRYRALARLSSGTSNNQTLYSPWSAYTAWVQLAAPPNAPMNLTPNGAVVAEGEEFNVTWAHNPVDSSKQTHVEIRYRHAGGGWFVRPKVAWGGDYARQPGSMDTAGFTPTVGVAVEFQVRTWGVHPDPSPWSAVASFRIISHPVVTVTTPDTVLVRPTILVEWGYSQAQGRPQSSWELELVHDSTVVESRAGSGAAGSVTLDARAANGETYIVRVRAANGSIWSEWAESIFDVLYSPPDAPIGFGAWNEGEGAVDVFVRPGEDEGAPPTTQLSVERSIDGENWEPILLDDAGEHSVTDGEALSNGVTHYRFTSFTFDGVSAVTLVEVESDSGALWLSAGEGFIFTARLPYDPQVGLTPWRERGRLFFDGRPKAVAYAGEHHATGVSGSGMIIEGEWPEAVATVNALEALFLDPAPIHLYRDPDGRRRYGIIDGSITRVSAGIWEFSFTLEETDRR